VGDKQTAWRQGHGNDEPFVAKLVEAAASIRVGNGLDESVQMGLLSSHQALERVLGYVEKGIHEGATLLLDGRKMLAHEAPKGYFVGPTIFTNVTPEMTIGREEIFGPVLGIIRVATLDEAIEVINSSPYGNAASLFTTQGKHAREFKYRVQAGNIRVNIGVAEMILEPIVGINRDEFSLPAGSAEAQTDPFEQALLTEDTRQRFYIAAAEKLPIREVARDLLRLATENGMNKDRLEERRSRS